jgi:thiamine-monophosphate kinase
MNCSDLGEFKLIARLARRLPRAPSVVAGVGDDCAVLRQRFRGRYLLFKTDPVIEGTHFVFGSSRKSLLAPATPFQVGWKAMARNLSDIAAMGGLPRWALVALGLPARTDVKTLDGIYRGLTACASEFGVVIVGGDTSQTRDKLFVVVSLIGEVAGEHLKLRSSARAGQMVFVTGALGGSMLGKHLKFTPRLKESRWLAEHFPVRAMIDLSDGLGGDLRRLAESSRVGFDIVADLVPVSSDAKTMSLADNRSPLEHAWGDGEDFELLFTMDGKHADDLLRRWHRKFPLPLTPIGVVTRNVNRIRLIGGSVAATVAKHFGYEHFTTNR